MTKGRLDGLYMLLLGTLAFLLLGEAGARTSSASMQDFKVLYYPARCLLQHCDPYNEGAVLRVFKTEGGERPSDSTNMPLFASRYIYLPSAFAFTVPLAMLGWGPAHILWLTLTVASLVFASFLIWDLGANYSPIISGCLIGFLLANSEVIFILCNAAGIAVSLCVVAVWCFLRERLALVGIFCLAVSLAIKPQDAGLVWLYFLLAGGLYRKRALQTLLATVAVSLPGVVWVWYAAPNWIQEWHLNMLAFSARGGLTDPGPASGNGYGLSMMVNLQTVFSALWDDARFYNLATYLVWIPLFLVWAVVTLRYRPGQKKQMLALAAITALSMVPVYHRLNDAKLLLLTVPACAMLWVEGGLVGWLALLVNSAGFALTADLPWAVLMGLVTHLHLSTTGPFAQMLRSAFVFPAPLMMLLMAVFYLWVYVSCISASTKPAKPGSAGEMPVEAVLRGSGTSSK